jgi:hypothetical protein
MFLIIEFIAAPLIVLFKNLPGTVAPKQYYFGGSASNKNSAFPFHPNYKNFLIDMDK